MRQGGTSLGRELVTDAVHQEALARPAVAAREFAAAVVAVGLIALLHFTWLMLRIGGADATQAFDNLLEVVLPIVATLACLAASMRRTGRARAGWIMLSLATLSWGFGQATWTFYEHVLGVTTPFPSAADAGYLGFIPLAAAGLLLFPMAPATAPGRTRAIMDGLIVSASLFFISWAVILGPAFNAPSESGLAKAVGLAYPLGDLVLASLIFFLATRAAPARLDSLLILWTGLVCITLADTGFAFLTLGGAYQTGHPIDVLWGLGFLLIALAALVAPSGAADRQRHERSAILGATVAYIPLLAALATASWIQIRDGKLEPVLFWTATALVLLVVGRQLGTLLENLTLNRRLAKVAAFKTELLQFVSHEMGGPLTPITLQLRLLQGPGAVPVTKQQQAAYAIMQRNLDRLSQLLGDVLQTVRIDAGRLKIEPAPTDLRQLVREGLDALRPQADAKGIVLESGPVTESLVIADPARIAQVLYNLLANALKFTEGGGNVRVNAARRDGEVVVRVTDTGIGLDSAQAAGLFQPFSRAHESPRGAPGTGLGLYICKGIIERHGGRIWVESPGPGQGADFCFTLPAA